MTNDDIEGTCKQSLKVHSHITSVVSFHLCHPVHENVNIKYEYNCLLPQSPFLTSDANRNVNVTCEQSVKLNNFVPQNEVL